MIRALLAAPPVLLGIAALVAAFPWPLADRLRRLAPVAAATAALGSALSLAALGLRGAPPVRLILSPWLDGDGPALESNALVAIALTVIGLLGLVAALRALAEEGTAAAPLAVCAAAALMASAGTERLGLVFGWIVLDATLAVVGGGRQGLRAGQAGVCVLLEGLTRTACLHLAAARPLPPHATRDPGGRRTLRVPAARRVLLATRANTAWRPAHPAHGKH